MAGARDRTDPRSLITEHGHPDGGERMAVPAVSQTVAEACSDIARKRCRPRPLATVLVRAGYVQYVSRIRLTWFASSRASKVNVTM
jgi:hypothetical protein